MDNIDLHLPSLRTTLNSVMIRLRTREEPRGVRRQWETADDAFDGVTKVVHETADVEAAVQRRSFRLSDASDIFALLGAH
ncbi:hypothetical protein L596_026844 [Steinernema carpocapsae]|uniref:Uncharacterized protein n=1 Tax=Steinernema carpocapsae TaxID=34508 RepID=A0A4U5M2J4_STECR|nr:hypothetical protein L596_026844 [Steinernema carpocapsae]